MNLDSLTIKYCNEFRLNFTDCLCLKKLKIIGCPKIGWSLLSKLKMLTHLTVIDNENFRGRFGYTNKYESICIINCPKMRFICGIDKFGLYLKMLKVEKCKKFQKKSVIGYFKRKQLNFIIKILEDGVLCLRDDKK